MSKNKNRNQQNQTLLSPKNYIKQKSRNLPIFKCIVNKDWDEGGLASILIARRHSNGNFTFCSYLVDKNCLGVKDTFYCFNEPQEALDEYEEEVTSKYEIEEISYNLAHNIIFAAIEFAEEYGFKPHRDFISITRYFLEEDDENIPLIDIHCGNKNGKPVYVSNGYETPALQQQIIKQLEKTAGKGNYEIYINSDSCLSKNYLDEDEFEEKDDDQDYNQWYEKFIEMDEEEFHEAVYETFLAWTERNEAEKVDIEDELFDKIHALTDILAEFDYEKIDLYYKKIKDDLAVIDTVDAKRVPNSLFPTFVNNGEELADVFSNAFMAILGSVNKKEVRKAIAKLALEYGDCGAWAYLKFISNSKPNKWDDIEKELKKFPDYFMLKLLQKEIETKKMSSEEARQELLTLAKGRTLTDFEMSQFMTVYAVRVFEIMQTDTPDHIEKLKALEILFNEDFSEEHIIFTSEMLLILLRILKINSIISRIVNDNSKN